jgi:hypothetical protein
MVQRAKLMALAADAALEKQLSITSALVDEQHVLQEQCTRLTAALELKTAELVALGSERSSLDALKVSLHAKMSVVESDSAQLRAELSQASEIVAMLRGRLEESESNAAASSLKLEDLVAQLRRKEEAITAVCRDKDSVSTSLAERTGENKILASNVMNLERKLAKAEDEMRGYEQRRQRDQSIIDDQQLLVEELRGKVIHGQAESGALRGRLTDAELSLQLAKAKQQSVRDILIKQGIILEGTMGEVGQASPAVTASSALPAAGLSTRQYQRVGDPISINSGEGLLLHHPADAAAPPPPPRQHPTPVDPFNLDHLVKQRHNSGASVTPLSLAPQHPPTNLQHGARSVNVTLESSSR